MDIDWLYYCYTTILGKSENEFWCATPAKVYKQLEIHSEVISKKSNSNRSNDMKKNSNEIYGETVRLKVKK
ncbi:hypothetical protein [Clostridium baratii]|uniref:hypothetical protein n=1 Tax=Clostridium baratii TaxID=1561 RepID=UPI0030D2406E